MRHSLWQSFQFAGRGLQAAFWSQRTMRVHMALAVAVVAASAWLQLSAGQVALLVLSMAAVLAAELMNTAVETIVDLLVGDNRHELAGRAKDLAAAAVLVTAAGAAVVGLVVLVPPVAAAIGAGRLGALVVGRAATLAAVLALVAVILRGVGGRAAATSAK
ncbi:MAG: diacylglycerol kinase family protein [Armatimonadota bacterium]|nr:diacylglycerol kinase family protein [Armatimonadota bacterium]